MGGSSIWCYLNLFQPPGTTLLGTLPWVYGIRISVGEGQAPVALTGCPGDASASCTPPARGAECGGSIGEAQGFSNFNVHMNHLEILLKFEF